MNIDLYLLKTRKVLLIRFLHVFKRFTEVTSSLISEITKEKTEI
jgi:hypothetical protein